MSAPRFIALEGVDGAGKSTQAELLQTHLEESGAVARVVREPGGTALGEAIRSVLLHARQIDVTPECEALLFLASRVQLYEEVIRPALAAGETIISDRFHLSTLVYQGAAGELGLERARELCAGVLADRRPHLNVVIELSPERCRARLQGPGDRFEGREGFLERVARGYRSVAGLPGDRVVRVSGEGTPQDVAARIAREVERHA